MDYTKLIKPIIIVLGLLTCLTNCISQNSVIQGKLILEIPKEYDQIAEKAKMTLTIKGKERTTIVDKDLRFTFYNIPSDTVYISTELIDHKFPTTYILYTKPNDTIQLDLPLSIACKYDQYKNTKICPVCDKGDKVIPIVYGLLSISKEELESTDKKYKAGGCVIMKCQPSLYCKRDDHEF